MPSWKDSVRVATTGNLNPFPPTGLLTIDGVALRAGDRVLVKDQANPSQNGIWVVAANSAWTRAIDANTSALMTPEMVVRVSEGIFNDFIKGSGNDHTEWTLTTQGLITLGTTGLSFSRTNLLRSTEGVLTINQYQAGKFSWIAFNLEGEDNGMGTGVKGTGNVATASGVWGTGNRGGTGVLGTSDSGSGVKGTSTGSDAVVGETSSPAHAGVTGRNLTTGANGGVGIYGVGGQFAGKFDGTVQATSKTQDAIVGFGGKNGVHGESASQNDSGVWGHNSAPGGPKGYGVSGTSDHNIGVYGSGGRCAGWFEGDVTVTGDVILANSSGGDCAEDFDVEDSEETITPGTVLVIGNEGKLAVSKEEYDSRIAGVVSGAGNLRPAILLNRIDSEQCRMPIALIGKAFCKVDATFAPIKPGDLLTTAIVPGHAMKVLDRTRAIGAILGKALDGLEDGQGLIPILVSPR